MTGFKDLRTGRFTEVCLMPQDAWISAEAPLSGEFSEYIIIGCGKYSYFWNRRNWTYFDRSRSHSSPGFLKKTENER